MGPPPLPDECARGGRGPMEYRVRLTHVASINPEYETYSSFQYRLMLNVFSRVLQGFLQGKQSSNDNTVLTAITVCTVYFSCHVVFSFTLPG
jgi:hypothetical protein